MRYRRVPDETIKRLPIYLRALVRAAAQGRDQISSRELAEFLCVNPWQIRKDFSFFGGFGKPGVGYDIPQLTKQIRKILRLGAVNRAALVGIGNLGSALLSYPGFVMYGFEIAAVFDSDPVKTGKQVNGVKIEDLSQLKRLKKRKIRLGIMAVPRDAAQETADALVKAGIKGILNFAPCHLQVPRRVKVITMDFAMGLARLPYYMPPG